MFGFIIVTVTIDGKTEPKPSRDAGNSEPIQLLQSYTSSHKACHRELPLRDGAKK